MNKAIQRVGVTQEDGRDRLMWGRWSTVVAPKGSSRKMKKEKKIIDIYLSNSQKLQDDAKRCVKYGSRLN